MHFCSIRQLGGEVIQGRDSHDTDSGVSYGGSEWILFVSQSQQ